MLNANGKGRQMDSLSKLLLLGCLLHACSRGEEGREACLEGTYVCQEEREEEGDCSINAGLLNCKISLMLTKLCSGRCGILADRLHLTHDAVKVED